MLSSRDGLGEVQTQLTAYLGRLPVEAEAVVLVGSRARGTHMRHSDIDLVVVSEAFSGMRRGDRIELLLQPYFDLPALEPMGYTAQELQAPDDLYLLDALADGRPLLDCGIWQQARARLQERLKVGSLVRTQRGWQLRAPGSLQPTGSPPGNGA